MADLYNVLTFVKVASRSKLPGRGMGVFGAVRAGAGSLLSAQINDLMFTQPE